MVKIICHARWKVVVSIDENGELTITIEPH